MKAKKKTNHLLEEADKIEHIPEEKNDGREGQDKPNKAKKPRKNRFLARLRKIWARITGCMRCCCTSIQDEESAEELPEPSGINMEEFPDRSWINMEDELPESSNINMEELPDPSEMNMKDSKDIFFTTKVSVEVKEENMEENQTDNDEVEALVTDGLEEKEIVAEHQRLVDVINSQEDLYFQYYTGQVVEEVVTDSLVEKEIVAEHQRLVDVINSQEDLYFQYYTSQVAKEVVTDSLVEKEIVAEHQRLVDVINSQEDLYFQYYTSQMAEEVVTDSLVEKQTEAEYQRLVELWNSQEPSTSDFCLEKLEQPGKKTPSTVPLTLESLTFHRKLGAGGFAEVYLASDIIWKQSVAIKVSNKCLFTEEGESLLECDILKLSHENPYLIHGLAAFHTENFVYYVLELATRGELFDFSEKNFPLDAPTIQFILAEVICGTQFLHKKDIIHRDFKSENILLTADGHIKITDFGIALMGVYDKTTEEPRGTPQYMAPELVEEEEYGRGVDYFAIGVILYDLYTNKLPFPGEEAEDVFYSILHHTPLYPEFLTPDTVDILQGLLCKDQDHRLGVKGDIKKHQFFSGINWEDVEARRMEPPSIMTADFVDLKTDHTLHYIEKQIYIRPEDQKIFKDLSFVCPDWSQDYHPANNEAI